MATTFQSNGIDISAWQTKDFDMELARKLGANYAIIRLFTAESAYNDTLYKQYYDDAKRVGMPVGFYVFGDAGSIADARAEANRAINLLKDLKPELPIFYDVESNKMMACDKRLLTDIIKTFCDILEQAGYWVGIYSSRDVYNNKMYDNELSKYSHWVAFWAGTKPVLKSGNQVQMWQTGVVKHWQGNIDVDQDICYVDYETLIKQKGLNNWGEVPDTKSQIEAQLAIIRTATDDIEKLLRGD